MTERFSAVIQGCMGWGKWGAGLSTAEMSIKIAEAVEMGITTFDHADIYGDYTTEAEFGEALMRSGINRSDIQLISKCGIQYVGQTRPNSIKHYQYDAEYIVWSAERSLNDLKTDHLDLFLLHRPSPLMEGQEIVAAVDKLKKEGKILSFGLSNFTPAQTDVIRQHVPVEVNQIEFSLTAHEAMWNGSLDHMQLHKIVPMAWSPLGSYFGERDQQTERIGKVLNQLQEKYNATADQILLAWIRRHPAGILPVIGTARTERMFLAVEATKIILSRVDWFELLVAARGTKVP